MHDKWKCQLQKIWKLILWYSKALLPQVWEGKILSPQSQEWTLWGWNSICIHPQLQMAIPCPRASGSCNNERWFLQKTQAWKLRATNGFETIYDTQPPRTCISIYLVSLTYTLFFQNHKHRCWNFMWKCLRGWKLTPLWSVQPHSGC